MLFQTVKLFSFSVMFYTVMEAYEQDQKVM